MTEREVKNMKKTFEAVQIDVIYMAETDLISTSSNNNEIDYWDQIIYGA